MINILTCIMFMFVALQTTILTTNYTGINETFKNVLKSAVEANVIVIDMELNPYFDKYNLKKYVGDNLKDNIFKYTKSFELKFFFFDQDTKELCDQLVCRAVQIRLITTYYQYFSYNKAFSLYISEGK